MKAGKLLAALLLFIPVCLHAQEAADAYASVRLLVAVSFVDVPEANTESYLSSAVTALARTEAVGAVRVYHESFTYGQAESERFLNDYAVRSGCRLVLSVLCTLTSKSISVKWRLRDIVLKLSNPEKFFDAEIPDAAGLAEYFWLELVSSVEKAGTTVVPQEFITIEAPGGSRVSGLGKELLVVPESGSIQVPVVIPQSATIRVQAPGFMPQERSLFLDRPGMRERFELLPYPAWALELGMYNLQFPGFRAQWRPGNDFWFVRAGFEQYLLGFILNESNSDSDYEAPLWYGGIPLFQVCLGAGMDISPPEKPVGFYANVDILLRVFFPQFHFIDIDPVAPVGIRPAVGAEYRIDTGFVIFAELGPVLYPFAKAQLMEASQNTQGPRFGMPLDPLLYIEWLSFRAGLRWRLP